MISLNKYTKTKSIPKPTRKFKNCSHVCVRIIVHNCRTQHSTTQYRTVLIIFPPNFQTVIKAQMLSIGAEGEFVNGIWHTFCIACCHGVTSQC